MFLAMPSMNHNWKQEYVLYIQLKSKIHLFCGKETIRIKVSEIGMICQACLFLENVFVCKHWKIKDSKQITIIAQQKTTRYMEISFGPELYGLLEIF